VDATLPAALPPAPEPVVLNGFVSEEPAPPILTVAAGDSYGRIRLLRYPATTAYAAAKCYSGHSTRGGVARVRWTQVRIYKNIICLLYYFNLALSGTLRS
jgi:hypothetical protein